MTAEYVALAPRRVQLGAHHTLAAIGYFAEHDAPWLFRRVHAGVTRLRALPVTAVVDTLVETGTSLPSFDLGPDGESFRGELRDFLAATPADPAALVPAMASRGWFGSAARARLGELAVTLQANRALVAAAIGATASGGGARLEAPMAGYSAENSPRSSARRCSTSSSPSWSQRCLLMNHGLINHRLINHRLMNHGPRSPVTG